MPPDDNRASAYQRIRDAITLDRCKSLLIELVKVPSPQTALMENEPLLKQFISGEVEPRLRRMGFIDIRYDGMGNLYSSHGAGISGRSLMLITNAMNQPQATMARAYEGDVKSGQPYQLPGEVVLGKGASEQKSNMAAMLVAMESVIASGVPITGRLLHLCCLSGETGKHDAIKSITEATGAKADMAFLGGTSLKLSLGNRGRIDIFIKVCGRSSHSSGPKNGCNAITGAADILRRLGALDLCCSDPRLGDQALTVNHIRSFPDSTHTIQDLCEITLDRRLLPGEDPDVAFAEIERIVMEVDGKPDPVSGHPYHVEVVKGPFMYPSLVATDAPIVTLLDSTCSDVLGAPPEHIYAPNAFDQGYLNHIGIPTVNWGPGEYRYAHTDLDMASVERVRDAALVFSKLIVTHLSEG
jgi:acetylornithine deacetylase/succinyl-diaminopimelate desuccinylase-like protein